MESSNGRRAPWLDLRSPIIDVRHPGRLQDYEPAEREQRLHTACGRLLSGTSILPAPAIDVETLGYCPLLSRRHHMELSQEARNYPFPVSPSTQFSSLRVKQTLDLL